MIPALIIALVLGGGVSLAANNALPGDALYGIKTSVNENIRSAFSFSDEAKAHWDAVLEARRLSEAEDLNAKGKLNATTEADLKARFETAASDFQKHIDAIEAKSDDKASLEARSDAEASLSAHQEVLMWLTNKSAEVNDLLSTVAGRLGAVAQGRASIEARIAASGSAITKSDAEHMKARAQSQINQFNALINKMKNSASATTISAAQAQAVIANQIFASASASLDAGNYADAYTHFQQARTAAQKSYISYDSYAGGVNKEDDNSNEHPSGNTSIHPNAGGTATISTDVHGDSSGHDTEEEGTGTSASGSVGAGMHIKI